MLGGRVDARQRIRRGTGKVHDESLRAQIAAELLAEQRFHVGLIIHNQNQNTHGRPLDFSAKLLVRGNTMRNSVKWPCSVSTSIVPPCCFTMISWLIDS